MIYIFQHKTENFLIKSENIKSFALNCESCRFALRMENHLAQKHMYAKYLHRNIIYEFLNV